MSEKIYKLSDIDKVIDELTKDLTYIYLFQLNWKREQTVYVDPYSKYWGISDYLISYIIENHIEKGKNEVGRYFNLKLLAKLHNGSYYYIVGIELEVIFIGAENIWKEFRINLDDINLLKKEIILIISRLY